MVTKVEMVQMVHLDNTEMMVSLGLQDLEDHVVIKAVMQLTKTALNVHHTQRLKVTGVLQVNQEILAHLAGMANQVHPVTLVDAFLVIVDALEQMVDQVKMELMADLVHQVNLEDLEMMFTFRILPVQIPSFS